MAEDRIEEFMAAIRKMESGSRKGNYAARNSKSGAYGAYQIMPQYWDGWATAAGIPGADIRDKAAQDYVAEYKFRQYYRKYQDWGLVAIAWFAGGSRADKAMQSGIGSVAAINDGATRVDEYYQRLYDEMGAAPEPNVEDYVAPLPEQVAPPADEFRRNLIGMLETMSNAVANGTRLPVGSQLEAEDLLDEVNIGLV